MLKEGEDLFEIDEKEFVLQDEETNQQILLANDYQYDALGKIVKRSSTNEEIDIYPENKTKETLKVDELK